MRLSSAYFFIAIILTVDQYTKLLIKTNFVLGEEVSVFNWFKILFIENEGMAWGTEIPGAYGKLFLTVFRLIAVSAIGYWLWDSCENKWSSKFLIVAISLIFAGALGNIVDSVFYGVLFDDSHHNIATLNSPNPYGTLFHGKVVDMFYFPIFEGNFPSWFPIWGGNEFKFFNAIFNVADLAISTGVGILIVFNKRAFQSQSPFLKPQDFRDKK